MNGSDSGRVVEMKVVEMKVEEGDEDRTNSGRAVAAGVRRTMQRGRTACGAAVAKAAAVA